ncbi:MAG: hypothetical protein KDC48_12060 [Planctomycetes bacterium]|nr:hypothetical protein [Planctomycetota bacterium]
MNHTSVLPVAFAFTLCLGLAAQVTIPVNPKATYLRTSNDPTAVPAPGFPLSAVGSGAGQLLSIRVVGNYQISGLGGDFQTTLVAVFSSSATLLPDGQLNRVPGAIAAGPDCATTNAYYSNVPTDIPQDFIVSRTAWDNGVQVRVPAGATHVFVATTSNFYGNHSDPNSNLAVVFEAGTPGTLPGTREHCKLLTGVGVTPTQEPDVKTAPAFSTISAEVRQVYGLSTGAVYILAGTVFGNSGPTPVGPLPDLHLGGSPALLQIGAVTTGPAQWSLFTPPGFGGTTLVLQAAFLDPHARNGTYMASNAHQIQLQ